MVSLIETFSCFSGTLLICPECGDALRIADLTFHLAGKIDGTIIDTLREKERLLQRQDAMLKKQYERFDSRWKAMREATAQRGRQKATEKVRRLDSTLSVLGFDPSDIKAMGYPVDLVVFDGLAEGQKIKKIVFIAQSQGREKFRKLFYRIYQVLQKGNVTWETVRIKTDGSIEIIAI